MTLNIVASRKVSLAGFAEGWDNCYVTVRAISEKTRKAWSDEMETKQAELEGSEEGKQNLEKYAIEFLDRQCRDVITGGVIMNTDKEGTTSEYTLSASEIPDLLEFLSFSWQQQIVSTATGTNRLKANQ